MASEWAFESGELVARGHDGQVLRRWKVWPGCSEAGGATLAALLNASPVLGEALAGSSG